MPTDGSLATPTAVARPAVAVVDGAAELDESGGGFVGANLDPGPNLANGATAGGGVVSSGARSNTMYACVPLADVFVQFIVPVATPFAGAALSDRPSRSSWRDVAPAHAAFSP